MQWGYGQTVIIPATNANDSSDNRPFGCYWGYERTHILLLQSEMGNTNYVTEVGFYVNSVNSPASSVPVVIRMKASNATSLTSATYANAINGATTVYSGNITAGMLAANSWITLPLTTAFYVGNSNLEIFVETNYGSYGGESMTAKQFRQSMSVAKCQFWYNDLVEPKDFGTIRNMRPNVWLNFQPACSGTPAVGTVLASSNPVCKDSLFVLSVSGVGNSGGLTYQWQSSSNGTNYTDITGATGATYVTSQTAAKFYQCQVTCSLSGLSSTATALQVTMKPHYNCHCSSFAFSNQDSKIDSVRLGTLVSGSSASQCESYTDNTALPAPLLVPAVPQKLKVVNGSCSGNAYDVFLNVYIDYNQNASFSSSNELVYSGGPFSKLNGIPEIIFTVPVTAQPGLTRMRLVLAEQDPASYCGGYSRGETEDYLVQIGSVTPCATTSWSAGTTLAEPATVCLGNSVVLSLDNYPSVSGLTYQWQSSLDNLNWSSITGATSLIYTVASVNQATYFRCRITCSGGQTQNSVPVQVTMNPFYQCYCPSYATEAEDTQLDTVMINGSVYGSSPQLCQTYSQHLLPVDVYLNITNTLSLTNGSCTGDVYPSWLAVYVDYNKDGDFLDANELVHSYGPVSGLNGLPDISFLPPGGTTAGLTGMRILLHETTGIPAPCSVSSYGETEDFVINLVTLPPCIDPPTAGAATVSVQQACADAFPISNVQLALTGNSVGIGQSYQWEQSPDGINWTAISGATGTTHFVTVTQTTYFRCQVSCGLSTVASQQAAVVQLPEPAGNNIAAPIVVGSLPFTFNGNNLSTNCFTDLYAGPDNQPSPDVFFRIPVDSTGTLRITTCSNLPLNTYLHILDENGNHLSSNDDDGPYCSGIHASDSVYHSGYAKEYIVVVEGQGWAEGSFELNISFEPDTGVGLMAPEQNAAMKVYPNPNDGRFLLMASAGALPDQRAELCLRNTLGQCVYEAEVFLQQGKLHARMTLPAHVTSGTYHLMMRTAQGVLVLPLVVAGR